MKVRSSFVGLQLATGLIAGFFFCAASGQAQPYLGGPTNVPLASWSFQDPFNWTSDQGYAPASFTNLAFSCLGDGQASTRALVVDTNVPAWLQYYVYEPGNAATNLTVDSGSVTFWFGPDWASTNQGGAGPGEWGRLFEVGSYTPDSSYGWWSIFVDDGGNNLYFAAQTNDLSSNITTYISFPISWTTNDFHFIALTYSARNTALYLDGVLATNGPPLTVYPGPDVLTNGLCIGSDTNGVYQAHGMFDLVATYDYPLDSNDVQTMFDWYFPYYMINPNNIGYMDTTSFQSSISYGTNLAISSFSLSNSLARLLVANSTADVMYEIQATTNLAQPNWTSLGFVYGSELTNWTLASLLVTNKPALFLRIRSWMDDGSGLPDWWQLQYFGYIGVDPYGDSAGDGWNNLEKFQLGMNPNLFYTPPAPQNLAVAYNANSGMANISWKPSPGPVTGYTIQRDEGFGNVASYNLPASPASFPDNLSTLAPYNPTLVGPDIYASYQVQAHYAGGNSAWSDPVELEPAAALNANWTDGPGGSAYLTVSALPEGTSALRVTAIDVYAEQFYNNSAYNAIFTIPLSNLTNGVYPIPASWQLPADGYGQDGYEWWIQAQNANGLTEPVALYHYTQELAPPFLDGRSQLKQNLIFQLREPDADSPFGYADYSGGTQIGSYIAPASYASVGFYDTNNPGISLNIYRPFEDNYLYRNFVFNTTNMDVNGDMTTGVADGDNYWVPGNYGNATPSLILQEPATFQFQPPGGGGTNIPALLLASQTQWLASYPLQPAFGDETNNVYYDLAPIGITYSINLSTYAVTFALANNAMNYFGLPIQSVNLAYQSYDGNGDPTGHLDTQTLSPGGSFPLLAIPNLYPQAAQPQLQTVEYDFWRAQATVAEPAHVVVPPMLPEDSGFSPTNRSGLLITQIGQTFFPIPNGSEIWNPSIQVAGYAKLSVTNGYPGVYAFLGQYFTNAYQIDANGNVTTNTTGVLSPYGDFFPTQPGPAALVTMPDIDTGQRGTGIVYIISVALDANHDGTMDTSFSGPDYTTQNKPYVFWANNNYDRQVLDGSGGGYYDDDVIQAGSAWPGSPFTGDCNYEDKNGFRVIPTTRDLEDFARLWVCGVTSNLLAALPTNSTVTLNWGDVGSPNPANPTIDLFLAGDYDGGIGYLTNATTATRQTNSTICPYYGKLGPGGSIQLNGSQFVSGWGGNHFIWCGVSNGVGQLNLTIADGNGNVLGQASAWIQIKDIKQMYERWTVGDNPYQAPANTPQLAATDLPTDAMQLPFQYSSNAPANTPYILFVHGWNEMDWLKDRRAEVTFKRLYWQGYQGRFGEFRWPTTYGFNWQSALFSPDDYDYSEYRAWQSGVGLLNLLTNLSAEYTGHVCLFAHSLGNVVAGEALRLAGTSQVVNTYVASQAALTAHLYDSTASTTLFSSTVTPNILTNWLASINGRGAGKIISYYNTNDYALGPNLWELDQSRKPEQYGRWGVYGFYGTPYDGTRRYTPGSVDDTPPWRSFGRSSLPIYYFDLTGPITNRYEVMAYADQPRARALGIIATETNLTSLNLITTWPPDPSGHNYGNLYWHSGEFVNDNVQQQSYWWTLLHSTAEGFGL